MKKTRAVGATATILFLFWQVALATVVSFPPMKDNTLYESSTGSSSNGAGDYLFVGRTNGGQTRRGLLAFDIGAAVPLGSVINSVTLTLHMSKTLAAAQSIELHKVLEDWGEGASNAGGSEGGGGTATSGDATWLHTFYNSAFWTNPGGDFSPTASAATMVGGVGSYTWGSTKQLAADVKGWLDAPSSNFGWLLLGNESASPTAKRLGSRENPTESLRPKLTVDYTAGPVTVSVLDIHPGGPDSISLNWSNPGPQFLYTVEFADTLAGANWSPIPPVEQWPTNVTTWSDILAPGQLARFYRVRGEQVP